MSSAAQTPTSLGRRFFRFYRRSKISFFLRYMRDARRLQLRPQEETDVAHLAGAWKFDTPVEREWQRHALAVVANQIGRDRWGDSLEIGCSEGAFTAELAQRCVSVAGFDISPVAVSRATERCVVYPNVRIGQLDAATEEIPGQYDIVFIMDVLCCVTGRARKASIVPKVARTLRSGGLLVFSDSRMPEWVRRPFWSNFLPTGADEWAKILEDTPGLTVLHKEIYPPDGHSIPGFWDKLFVLFRKETAV